MKKKFKTKQSLSRRIKVTAGGKLFRGRSFKRHLRRNKSAAQKRRYRKTTELTGAIALKAKKRLGIA